MRRRARLYPPDTGAGADVDLRAKSGKPLARYFPDVVDAAKPKLVVRDDRVSDDRFRHGTKLMRWRTDKAPLQCILDALKPPAPPAEVEAVLRGLP